MSAEAPPQSPAPADAALERLRRILAQLRGPEGCPWDREQTSASLKPQLLEECHEVLEAIESGQPSDLKEELGDLLLHIVFQAELAQEKGDFTLAEVADAVCEKLVRRHPHVFGETRAATSGEVVTLWQRLKQIEKPERTGPFDGVPLALPALMRAQAVQKRAARLGFDWPEVQGSWAKVREEVAEVSEALARGEAAKSAETNARLAEELGDLFFSLVNVTRHLHLDAEQVMAAANAKFVRRFAAMQAALAEAGGTAATLAEMERAWQTVKARETG